jgi:hypothetical protein
MSYLHKTKRQFLIPTARHVRKFWFLAKVVLLKAVRLLKINQHAKFHGPTLSGECFASTSSFNVRHFGNGRSYEIKVMASMAM